MASQSAMCQEERTTMCCVRAWRAHAATELYLEEGAGYGQAYCRIMPGTRELHGPASHWPLPGAALRSARTPRVRPSAQLAQIRQERSQLLGAMWSACWSKSAHEGAQSGMLCNEQKGQEFIFFAQLLLLDPISHAQQAWPSGEPILSNQRLRC